jgi:sigma-B regulation protein RsbU (phosphoserine phosphatase)
MNVIRFAVAVLVAASGIVSFLLFIARIRRRDYSLLYFGLGASMYGVRLFLQVAGQSGRAADLALALLISVPLMLFMVELAAREWRKVAWWIVGADLVVAAVAMSAFLLHHWALSWRINNFFVLVSIPLWVSMAFWPRRPRSREMRVLRTGLIVFLIFVLYTILFFLQLLPGSGDLEFIGFSFLLCCLAYVALSRTQRNEERLLTLHRELEIARNIQAQLLPETTSVPGLVIASRYIPASSVAGDFYDFLLKDGALGVLIADVSGHGVPAALSASMVKVAVRSQLERAGDPAAVLRGMNAILCGNLQGQFVSAGYLFLNPGGNVMRYAGAGHPPVLIWRSRQRQVESLEENGLLLGILPNAGYTEKTAPLERGDRCVLYTDGLLEATCPEGEEFGPERLQDFVAENASLAASAFCNALVQKLADWRGETGQQQDDLTIVAVDFA